MSVALSLLACEPVEVGGGGTRVSYDAGSTVAPDAATADAASQDAAAADASADATVADSGANPDSGASPDSGAADSGAPDTGTADAGVIDSGAPDTGTPDTGVVDSGAPDSGAPDSGSTPDSGAPDTGTPDSGAPDSGSTPDSGTPDSGSTPDSGTTADAGSAIFSPQIVFTEGGSIVKSTESFTARGEQHEVRFVHQSTGNYIWQGGVADAYELLRPDDTITEDFGPRSDSNGPSDYDAVWVNGSGLNDISEDIIIFKHCYTDDPTNDLDYRKQVYEALKTKFHSEDYSSKIFIAWTVPPMTATEFASKSGNAENAREFYRWMLEDWDEPGDNIYIFDYRILATRGRDRFADSDALGASDSHPNPTFSAEVAPCFARRIAEVANGDGDTTSRTGGCTVR